MRRLLPAASAIAALLVLLSWTATLADAGAQPRAAGTVKPTTCAKAIGALRSYLADRDPEQPVIRRPRPLASFVACRDADTWRVRGEKAGIGGVLGPLLGSPSLDTARALDVLCQHFDAYDRTATCKGRNG
jgi:hypothetical protein